MLPGSAFSLFWFPACSWCARNCTTTRSSTRPRISPGGMEWLSLGTYNYEALHPPLARAATALPLYLEGLRSQGHKDMAVEGSALLATGDYQHNLLLSRLGVMPFFWLANLPDLPLDAPSLRCPDCAHRRRSVQLLPACTGAQRTVDDRCALHEPLPARHAGDGSSGAASVAGTRRPGLLLLRSGDDEQVHRPAVHGADGGAAAGLVRPQAGSGGARWSRRWPSVW